MYDDYFLRELLYEWINCTLTTREFLTAIPSEVYLKQQFAGERQSFADIFAWIARWRYLALDSFRHGVLKLDRTCDGLKLSELKLESQGEMFLKLEQLTADIAEAIPEFSQPYDYGHFKFLAGHERFRHGELAARFETLDLEVSDMFRGTWVL